MMAKASDEKKGKTKDKGGIIDVIWPAPPS